MNNENTNTISDQHVQEILQSNQTIQEHSMSATEAEIKYRYQCMQDKNRVIDYMRKGNKYEQESKKNNILYDEALVAVNNILNHSVDNQLLQWARTEKNRLVGSRYATIAEVNKGLSTEIKNIYMHLSSNFLSELSMHKKHIVALESMVKKLSQTIDQHTRPTPLNPNSPPFHPDNYSMR